MYWSILRSVFLSFILAPGNRGARGDRVTRKGRTGNSRCGMAQGVVDSDLVPVDPSQAAVNPGTAADDLGR